MGNKNGSKKNNQLKNKDIIINEYKIIFVGESGVGAKTCLLNRLDKDIFDLNCSTTNGDSLIQKSYKHKNGKIINLNLWDSFGQKTYRFLTEFLMKDSDCVVLGFDITNEESFKNIQDYWYPKSKEISGANLFYLVGNKIDLALDRKVDKNIARKFAEENGMKYFEISCLTSEGINI